MPIHQCEKCGTVWQKRNGSCNVCGGNVASYETENEAKIRFEREVEEKASEVQKEINDYLRHEKSNFRTYLEENVNFFWNQFKSSNFREECKKEKIERGRFFYDSDWFEFCGYIVGCFAVFTWGICSAILLLIWVCAIVYGIFTFSLYSSAIKPLFKYVPEILGEAFSHSWFVYGNVISVLYGLIYIKKIMTERERLAISTKIDIIFNDDVKNKKSDVYKRFAAYQLEEIEKYKSRLTAKLRHYGIV